MPKAFDNGSLLSEYAGFLENMRNAERIDEGIRTTTQAVHDIKQQLETLII